MGSALVVALFMVLLQIPGTSSAVLLPLLALTWAATFPLAIVAQVRGPAMERALRPWKAYWRERCCCLPVCFVLCRV